MNIKVRYQLHTNPDSDDPGGESRISRHLNGMINTGVALLVLQAGDHRHSNREGPKVDGGANNIEKQRREGSLGIINQRQIDSPSQLGDHSFAISPWNVNQLLRESICACSGKQGDGLDRRLEIGSDDFRY